MYILKNAWTNIKRNKGRNILIGIIITVIVASSCIALSISSSGNKLIDNYTNKNQLEVSFRLDMKSLRQDKSDGDSATIEALTAEDIKTYADSKYVSSYYYTLETSLSSDEIKAIDMSEAFEKKNDSNDSNNQDSNRPDNGPDGQIKGNQGDFKITAYSDVSFIENFINGTSKITDGKMLTNDDEENSAVVSQELAEENDLKVGDTFTLYLPSDSSKTYTFKIVGIYETEADSGDNFMSMTALNSQNQIYTTLNVVNSILKNDDNANSLNAKFYLKDSSYLEKFEKEVREKGLSDYYQVSDNTEEITSALKPIQNISNFSKAFLIIILIVGAIVLAVINMLNIRDRKYEIGVLRSIGMGKTKVVSQLLLELFIVGTTAFIIGTASGYALSQPVTNKMLENEINSYTEEQTQTENNFGGPGFNRPGHGMLQNNNYIDNLTVSPNAVTIIELFGVTMILIIISGSVTTFFVTKYEPNRIMQNRT